MRGHVREKTPGVWEIIVSAGRDPTTRRRRQISRTVHGNRDDAEKMRTKLLGQIDHGEHRDTEGSFGALLEEWLRLSEHDLSATTIREYRRLVRVRIKPALGAKPLRRLGTADLDKFYLRLRDELAPASVRQVHAICRKALTQAVRWGLILVNPAVNATVPKQRKPDVNPPSVADMVRLLSAAEEYDPRLYTLLRLASATGARRGELCGLRWGNVDLEGHSVLISRSVVDVAGRLEEKGTKTHGVRRVAIDVDTSIVLADWKASMARLAADADCELSGEGFVFSNAVDGSRPWRPDQATGAFRRLAQREGVTARLHDVRHFHATRLLAAGMDVRTVAGRLGHATAATTLTVYSHFVEERDRHAADIIGDLLGKEE